MLFLEVMYLNFRCAVSIFMTLVLSTFNSIILYGFLIFCLFVGIFVIVYCFYYCLQVLVIFFFKIIFTILPLLYQLI